MSKPRVALILVTLAGIAAGLSCGGKKSSTIHSTGGEGSMSLGDLALIQGDQPDGLTLRLSDGKESAAPTTPVTPAQARRLADSEAEVLLGRMKPLEARTDDQQSFSLRDRSRPAPRTGRTIQGAFPPPESQGPPPAAAGQASADLEIVRWSPEGEVPLAPHLSITFSQPMIAVTSHEDTVKDGVPVKLTPTPPGTWRWVGTRTLLFDADPRLPQATEYRVEIPAGTRSATGSVLREAKSWTFTTPAPRVQQSWPTDGPQPREPSLFVRFDQDVDAAAVLQTIQVRAAGQTWPVRMLTQDEIAGHVNIRGLVDQAEKNAQSGRVVAFRVVEPLPADTLVEVDVGPGTPSREGPRASDSAQSFSFRTYGPLRVQESRCSWGLKCPPMTPWQVRMSNPLDMEAFDGDAIRVSPALPGLRVDASGAHISIRGLSKGRTTYKVTLPASLTDRFGQTLGREETLTFVVGSADPRFFGPSGVVVLDPAARRRSFDVFSINHEKLKVRLYAVTPKDWDAFAEHMRDPYERPGNDRSYRLKDPPGRKVVDTTIAVKGAKDELVETAIDLAPALENGLGHVIAVVEPTPWPHRHRPPVVQAWVQSTQIGLDAFVDNTEMVAWATKLKDGAPLAGVNLEILPHGITARSSKKGVATLPLADRAGGRHILVATHGQDTAILPENIYWWSHSGSWVRNDPGVGLRWYVFDDRAMYKPGETVRLKGWARRIDNGKGGDILPLSGAVSEVSYTVIGPRGNELLKGKAPVNALGGFDTSFQLPDTPNLGWARVELSASGRGKVGNRRHSHRFQIQEFRRPEFEVGATASQGPHKVGGSAEVTVKASYYAGGPLAGADVSWSVNASRGSFTPPGRDDFIFGAWRPWWGFHHSAPSAAQSSHTHQAMTDATGTHVLRMDFLAAKPPLPMQVSAQATVMDVNRQAWSSSANLLVHPADLYVGLKVDKYFVNQGEPLELEAIVVDHDGKAVTGTGFQVSAVRLDWAYERGEYVTKERDPQTCEHGSAAEPLRCSFRTREGGQYRITARVADAEGRLSQTELTLWVSGGKQPAAREVEQERVTLIPDQKEYKAGDTARILVQAPFYPAEGILSLRRSGMVSTQRFTLDKPSTTLEVPIIEGYVPNVHVQVDLVGATARIDDRGEPVKALPDRPAFAKGNLNLPVPPLRRVLGVTATPRDPRLAPGEKTSIDVAVKDATGRPVAGAELAVVVVDEAVLALSSYQLADPTGVFYGQRGADVRDHHGRQNVKLARPDADTFGVELAAADLAAPEEAMALDEGAVGGARLERSGGAPPPPSAAAPSAAMRGRAMLKSQSAEAAPAQEAQTPIGVRTNFDALAVFAPAVRTDAQGKAVVEVAVPDNLTRYRVMAVAVAEDRYFGKGESSITARMPLMVRPSPPRFLNFGDTFELPVVVQNQTDAPMTVRVAVRAANALITEGQGRELAVPANDRVEVRFPAAAELAGTTRFQVAAAAGSWADAAELALPVWTPATTEAFATYGEIDSGAIRQPVALPGEVVTQFGGLEITTSSTQLQALTDAFLYLVSYPFECAEQLSSRVVAVAALRDVLTAFEAEGLPPPAEIEAAVRRDIDKLRGMQNHDGGFGFWQRGHPSWPFVSIHVAHALTRARAKGFDVPQDMLDRALGYLRNVERYIPSYYSIEVRRSIIAYALSVRKRMGDADPARARKLIQEAGLDELSLEAVGWLLGVLAGDSASRDQIAAIHRHLKNRVSETAAAAHFTTRYSDGAHLLLHSDRRADGVILEALIEDQPRSDLIPKLVRGLLAHRKRGRWGNTQDNAFVLLALDRYFHVFEKATPNFVARAWLGDAFAGEHRFRGRSTDSHQIDIPMRYVAELGQGDLILQKDGTGRMYYRVGMTYAPASLELAPADHGFAVERRYEHVDDPADVTRLPDGTWKIKAGARVRVRLTMVAPSRRYHVALVDPLPAGLEAMNPALAVTGAIPQDPAEQQRGGGRYWWWQRTWYEHQNMRDERVEAFSSLLWDGVHDYTYVARATTPGRFVVPPSRAEEMYFPETFGRSASDVVIVE